MDTLSLLAGDFSLAHVAMLVAILAASAVMSGLSGFGFSAIGALSLFVLPPLLAVPLLMTLSTANQMLSLNQLKADFKPLKATLSGSTERVFMKLVVDRETQIVLGVHMVGADAAEIIQSIAIAVKMGATKAQFDATIGIHPTAAEEFVTMRTPEPEPVEPALQAAGE